MDDFGIAYDYHGEITDVNALTIPQSSFSKAPSSMSNDPPVTIPTSAQWQPPSSQQQQQQQQQNSASQVRTPPRVFHDEVCRSLSVLVCVWHAPACCFGAHARCI